MGNKRMALIELSKSDVLEILKALSRVEGSLMAKSDTYHIAELLDWSVETLTKKLLGEQADVLY